MKPKYYIVKRLRDGVHLTIGEQEYEQTINRVYWDGSGFVKEFSLVGEMKDVDAESAELFGEK